MKYLYRLKNNDGKGFYRINIPSADDDGVGSGFPVGVINFKDIADNTWYSVQISASGYTSSSLGFPTASYYDTNYYYQLLFCDDGNSYPLFLSASVLVVSQSAVGISSSYNSKPNLLLLSCVDNTYHTLYLHNNAGTIEIQTSSLGISQSLINL